MQDITHDLDAITGGAARPQSNPELETALTGITSALDSLKARQTKSPLEQLLPVMLVAKWARQNG